MSTKTPVQRMKVVIETSVLISGSIFWRYKDDETGETYEVSHKHLMPCSALFDILRKLKKLEVAIVTETAEYEAKGTLDKAIDDVIGDSLFPSLEAYHKIMALQDIIWNDCRDYMETRIEEMAERAIIRRSQSDWIVSSQLRPFFRRIVPSTLRYVQPRIPPLVKDPTLRNDLADIMFETIPATGKIYKGFPEESDLVIMAEATFINRKFRYKEKVYVVSLDAHFIPNLVQVGSFLTGRVKLSRKLDPTVRDDVARRFGFTGEHPNIMVDVLKQTYARELASM
jgi:hypothetical protein